MSSNETAADTAATMAHILGHCRTVAVVGLSPKPHRDSYEVSQYMQENGWRIIPVNPVAAASGQRILGERVYATLTEAAAAESIDLVEVFRNSADVQSGREVLANCDNRGYERTAHSHWRPCHHRPYARPHFRQLAEPHVSAGLPAPSH